MKDKTARVLAIIALVFMLIFLATLIATFIDYKMLNGAVGFISLGSGVFVLIVLLALRADGRGFSMTKLNNEIELQKIEEELAKRREADAKGEAPDEKNDDENSEQKPDKNDVCENDRSEQ